MNRRLQNNRVLLCCICGLLSNTIRNAIAAVLCPSKGIPMHFDAKCIYFAETKGKQTEYSDRCTISETYGMLITIESCQKNHFITRELETRNGTYWISVAMYDRKKFKTVQGKDLEYVNWAPNYPKSKANKVGGVMNSPSVSKGLWTDDDAMEGKHGFICVLAPVSSCLGEWYGKDCDNHCSDKCVGTINKCNPSNGTCFYGCLPGYQGDKCNQRKTEKNYHNEEVSEFYLDSRRFQQIFQILKGLLYLHTY
ncbi:C-type mannose receptor 2 [Elysia marginata]|uniref:C-type mannose receptor 2 n=1 Tax=Elysia marginata TaxID=1093978 RepID=A0AAV4FQQ5_9GAST|nr:C-type mannose receptor 2 [Elysia marginata]